MQYRYDNQKAYMAIHNMNKLDLRTFLFFVCLKGKLVNLNLLSSVYLVNFNPLVFFSSLENKIVLLSGHVQAKKKNLIQKTNYD